MAAGIKFWWTFPIGFPSTTSATSPLCFDACCALWLVGLGLIVFDISVVFSREHLILDVRCKCLAVHVPILSSAYV